MFVPTVLVSHKSVAVKLIQLVASPIIQMLYFLLRQACTSSLNNSYDYSYILSVWL